MQGKIIIKKNCVLGKIKNNQINDENAEATNYSLLQESLSDIAKRRVYVFFII